MRIINEAEKNSLTAILKRLNISVIGYCPVCSKERGLNIIDLSKNQYECPKCQSTLIITEDKKL